MQTYSKLKHLITVRANNLVNYMNFPIKLNMGAHTTNQYI